MQNKRITRGAPSPSYLNRKLASYAQKMQNRSNCDPRPSFLRLVISDESGEIKSWRFDMWVTISQFPSLQTPPIPREFSGTICDSWFCRTADLQPDNLFSSAMDATWISIIDQRILRRVAVVFCNSHAIRMPTSSSPWNWQSWCNELSQALWVISTSKPSFRYAINSALEFHGR